MLVVLHEPVADAAARAARANMLVEVVSQNASQLQRKRTNTCQILHQDAAKYF